MVGGKTLILCLAVSSLSVVTAPLLPAVAVFVVLVDDKFGLVLEAILVAVYDILLLSCEPVKTSENSFLSAEFLLCVASN